MSQAQSNRLQRIEGLVTSLAGPSVNLIYKLNRHGATRTEYRGDRHKPTNVIMLTQRG